DGDAECAADREPEERRVERPDDRGQDAELALVGVPGLSGEESDSVALYRRERGARDVPHHVEDQGDCRPGDEPRAGAEDAIDRDLPRGRRAGDGVAVGRAPGVPGVHVPPRGRIDLLWMAHQVICSSAFVTSVTTPAGSGMYPSSSLNFCPSVSPYWMTP